jgi:hypothetical protein
VGREGRKEGMRRNERRDKKEWFIGGGRKEGKKEGRGRGGGGREDGRGGREGMEKKRKKQVKKRRQGEGCVIQRMDMGYKDEYWMK